MEGVTGSIPVAPTIETPRETWGFRPFWGVFQRTNAIAYKTFHLKHDGCIDHSSDNFLNEIMIVNEATRLSAGAKASL